MNCCRSCGRTYQEHCALCGACSVQHVCQAPAQVPFHTVNVSDGIAVIGERRP